MKLKKWLDKRIRNLTLMIASQLLLTLFVGYWIHSQYEKEKIILSNELHSSFFNARAIVEDQAFFNQFILPFMDEKDSIEFDESALNTILNGEKKELLYDSIRSLINANKGDVIQIQEFLSNGPVNTTFSSSTRSILFSFRRAIYALGINDNYVPGSFPLASTPDRPENNQNRSFEENQRKTDAYLADFLNQKNINVSYRWFSDSVTTDLTHDPFTISLFNRQRNEKRVIIVFEAYNLHLLKVLSPQITFIAVLLSLTGFSLNLTYRGYVRQMKLNTLRNDFVNNITHELKIPVATAKAALEALSKFGLSADENTRSEYIGMVNAEMDRLDKLTNRVLNHAKLEDKKLNIVFEETELVLFIEEIVKASVVLFASSNVQINFEKPINAIYGRIDRLHFEGALKNLIENSVKYGGDHSVITIQIIQSEQDIKVIVNDDGPGIPKEYLNKVFEKFFRVPKGDTHNVKGYGLGLSYVSLVLDLHGGDIRVRNPEEGGCEFVLTLPQINRSQ